MRTPRLGVAAAAGRGTVIGKAAFRGARGKVRVKVPVAQGYRAALKSGQISEATAVFRRHSGKVVKRQRLKIK